jgi:hypothetical protein
MAAGSVSNFLVKVTLESVTLTKQCDLQVGDHISIALESSHPTLNKVSASQDIIIQANSPRVLPVNQTLSLVGAGEIGSGGSRSPHQNLEKFYLVLRRNRRNSNNSDAGHVGVALSKIAYET